MIVAKGICIFYPILPTRLERLTIDLTFAMKFFSWLIKQKTSLKFSKRWLEQVEKTEGGCSGEKKTLLLLNKHLEPNPRLDGSNSQIGHLNFDLPNKFPGEN